MTVVQARPPSPGRSAEHVLQAMCADARDQATLGPIRPQPAVVLSQELHQCRDVPARGREGGRRDLTLGKIVCEAVIRRAEAVAPAEKDHC